MAFESKKRGLYTFFSESLLENGFLVLNLQDF